MLFLFGGKWGFDFRLKINLPPIWGSKFPIAPFSLYISFCFVLKAISALFFYRPICQRERERERERESFLYKINNNNTWYVTCSQDAMFYSKCYRYRKPHVSFIIFTNLRFVTTCIPFRIRAKYRLITNFILQC